MNRHGRRGFIAGSFGAFAALVPGLSLFSREAHAAAPDESWLRGLTGKHRQFFDVGAIQGGAPLRRIHNFLATYASAYGVKESDVNAVFGAHGGGLGFVLGDGAWSKYELGATYGVNDPATGKPSVRNLFVEMTTKIGVVMPEASISRLQARGVRFLACNNTLTGLSETLAARFQSDAAAVRQDLVAAVLPGVTIVPAMAIAGNRAQESGLTYASLG
jgi:intracellular sulfur oxidation DsrE/DsrF family protein